MMKSRCVNSHYDLGLYVFLPSTRHNNLTTDSGQANCALSAQALHGELNHLQVLPRAYLSPLLLAGSWGSQPACAGNPKQRFHCSPEALNAGMRNVFSYCFRKPLGEGGGREEEIESEATIYLMLKGTAKIPRSRLLTEPSSIWKAIRRYSWSRTAPVKEEGASVALAGILVLQGSFSAW